ncbi:MAG: hypothetical protein NZ601_03880, partial [candidate division WOR-3 bacterium]|nr:hypothetical protein [candidate division WOR-3 bacterium]
IAIKFLHGIVEQKADEEIETISQNATEENYKVAAIAVALFDYFAKYKTVNKNPIAKEISGWKLQARRENLRSN